MRGQESMRHGQRRQHRQPDIDRRKLVFIHDREDQWHQQHKSDLITSKLLSKAAIFVSLYINCLLTLLYITALDNIIFHLDRFLSQTLSSWSLSHEHSVISLGIILM